MLAGDVFCENQGGFLWAYCPRDGPGPGNWVGVLGKFGCSLCGLDLCYSYLQTATPWSWRRFRIWTILNSGRIQASPEYPCPGFSLCPSVLLMTLSLTLWQCVGFFSSFCGSRFGFKIGEPKRNVWRRMPGGTVGDSSTRLWRGTAVAANMRRRAPRRTVGLATASWASEVSVEAGTACRSGTEDWGWGI